MAAPSGLDRAALYRAAFDESPIALLLTRLDQGRASTVVAANPAAVALLDRPLAEVVGADLREVLVEGEPLDAGLGRRLALLGTGGSADPSAAPSAALGAPSTVPGAGSPEGGPISEEAADELARSRWLLASTTPLSAALPGGEPTALVVLHDVTERRIAEERLNRAARHDPLTGLVNRAELLRLLGDVEPAAHGPHVAVVFIDLDGFKLVNDTRGHHVGDELLVAVARRIRGALRPEDSLARIGGDEFVVVCPGLADPKDARAVAERVRATLDRPLSIEGRTHRISMSVGIAVAPADAVDPADLLRQADMAMYRAKDAGRNTVRVHSADMDAELVAGERIREALGSALAVDGPHEVAPPGPPPGAVDRLGDRDRRGNGLAGLLLHYQPIVEIASGRLAYVEALARLRDAAGSLVYPSQFLPVAGRSGLNGALSEEVLRQALRQRARWRVDGIDVPIGLNLTPGQVFSATFAGEALQIIAEERDTPAGVVLEMGEFGLLEPTGPAQLTLRRLRASGVGLAIDHFGTGYSSLGALRFLGPHRVKIDRSFVSSIAASAEDRAIVTAAISAAHALGQRVVAEGVETSQQLEVLVELGADEAQGFLIAQVLPADGLRLGAMRWQPGTLARLP